MAMAGVHCMHILSKAGHTLCNHVNAQSLGHVGGQSKCNVRIDIGFLFRLYAIPSRHHLNLMVNRDRSKNSFIQMSILRSIIHTKLMNIRILSTLAVGDELEYGAARLQILQFIKERGFVTIFNNMSGSPIILFAHHFLRKCLLKNPLTTWYILLVKLDLS